MCAMPPRGHTPTAPHPPVEGDDVRPHVAGVVIQFVRDSGEVNGIVITEETVFTQPLRSRPQGDVLGVAIH